MLPTILLIVVVVIGGVFYWMMHFSGDVMEMKAIRAAPRVQIAAAQPGQALRLVGAVRIDDPLRSPLSGRTCVWYRVVVTRGQTDAPLLELTDVRDFALEDDSGRAEILATGAVAFVTTPAWTGGSGSQLSAEARALLAAHHIEEPLLATASTLVTEHVLEADSQALVYGFVDLEAGTGGSYREASRKVVVRQPLRITDNLSLA